MNLTANTWAQVLGEPVAYVSDGVPSLLSGNPLTESQLRAIQPLVESGAPEIIDDTAIDNEATRRINALIRPQDQIFLIASAMPAIVEELAAIRSGDPEPASFLNAKANLAVFQSAAAVRAVAEAIKASDPRPADFESLIQAFNSSLT
ncbi:MAG: hypothetical protein AAF546_00250 [Verrucomicrobiota bacterium]